VDLTPGALLNRLQRGVVYAPEKASQALQNFFKESTLVALRELALRQTAHELDVRQTEDRVNDTSPASDSSEKILVFITPDPSSIAIIRRARRVADYLHAECIAAAVQKPGEMARMSSDRRFALERNLGFARNLHIETHMLEGEDAARTLVDFARDRKITHVFVARAKEKSRLLKRPIVSEIVRQAEDMQVTLVAERRFMP